MDITVTQIGEDWSILTKELIDQENLIKHLQSLGFQTTVNHETLYIALTTAFGVSNLT